MVFIFLIGALLFIREVCRMWLVPRDDSFVGKKELVSGQRTNEIITDRSYYLYFLHNFMEFC